MLHTHLENGHFSLLPTFSQTNQSDDSFILSDRPDSSQLVDLHIYLVPRSVWRNIQHLAENDAVSDAISAGFVRVQPEMKLSHLRQSIEKACGTERYFPRDFIFLRSVGRCFTKVKPNQEHELKVKNYRPPQTSAPEVYLLEGRYDGYSYLPSESPIFSSVNYLFGNRFQYANQSPSSLKPTHRYQKKSRRTDKTKLPKINTSKASRRLSRKNSWKSDPVIDSDSDASTASKVTLVTNSTSRSLSKLKEEQERLRKRQAELEYMRRLAEEKKLQSNREETYRQPRRQEKAPPERKGIDYRRQEEVQSEVRRPEKTLYEPRRQEKVPLERPRPEKKPSEPKPHEKKHSEPRLPEKRHSEPRPLERIQPEPRRQAKVPSVPVHREQVQSERRQPVKLIVTQRRASHDATPTTLTTQSQPTYRTFNEQKAFRKRQISLIKNDSRKSSANSHVTIETHFNYEKTIDANDDELSAGEILSRSSSIGSTSDEPSHPSRAETRILNRERRDSTRSNSSSLLSMKSERKLSSKTKEKVDSPVISDTENRRTATVTRTRSSKEQLVHISTPDISVNENTYELERRAGEVQRRRQAQEDKERLKELKEQQRRELELSHDDLDGLRNRLQASRAKRIDLERSRDEAVSQMKSLYKRLTLRRQEVRDLWKKKYYQEKKRTQPLEQNSQQSTSELDRLHKKTEQTIENEWKHATEMGYTREADTGKSLLQVTRVNHEMQNIQTQIEQAKLRLSTDIKLRNQAENECKMLRQELSQAKLNLNRIKYSLEN
ncbi:unnamed protein product [Adineta ricciae]|uniref:Spermatogenesis-associated protein 1 C-terminal domain-containing protein n=1 Tax=Adineta ricciae TaxID=249248 RepID=A0A814HZH0_ADIRI|nr:unnamed protein product [Adineta ricciae]CAF1018270.1 unnamed protein product [Adineta ricciae]